MKKGIIFGGLVLGVGAIGGLLLMSVISPNLLGGQTVPGTSQAEAVKEGKATANEGHSIGVMYHTKERVVNLADREAYRYLKTEIVLEFGHGEKNAGGLKGEAYKKKEKELAEDLSSRTPVIDDAITSILTSRTTSEIVSAQGKEKLKEEIKNALNKIAGGEKIINVYFTQFIIQ